MKLAKMRRLTELFVVGKAVPLGDGTHIWVQALNAYQRDECIHDAQVARARLVMALQQAGEERMKIEARFHEVGRERHIKELASTRATEKMGDSIEALRADPEWKERMDILMRTDANDTAAPLTPEEIALLADVNERVMNELRRREKDENDWQRHNLETLSDDELIDQWTEQYIEKRGSELAGGEYTLTEVWFCARDCEAVTDPEAPDEELDHSQCGGHQDRVFETRQQVREAPTALVSLISDTLTELNVSGLDPKGSGKAASSSGSSPTPSVAEESKPSTSTATPSKPPGT